MCALQVGLPEMLEDRHSRHSDPLSTMPQSRASWLAGCMWSALETRKKSRKSVPWNHTCITMGEFRPNLVQHDAFSKTHGHHPTRIINNSNNIIRFVSSNVETEVLCSCGGFGTSSFTFTLRSEATAMSESYDTTSYLFIPPNYRWLNGS